MRTKLISDLEDKIVDLSNVLNRDEIDLAEAQNLI